MSAHTHNSLKVCCIMWLLNLPSFRQPLHNCSSGYQLHQFNPAAVTSSHIRFLVFSADPVMSFYTVPPVPQSRVRDCIQLSRLFSIFYSGTFHSLFWSFVTMPFRRNTISCTGYSLLNNINNKIKADLCVYLMCLHDDSRGSPHYLCGTDASLLLRG